MDFIKHHLILAIVFLTGAAVLVVEVVATRILAPYFGNTIFSFSSILGVILAALSCGYYWGGWLADRKASYTRFFMLIFFGGLSVFILKIIMHWFLPSYGYELSMISGPLITSLLLFFIPGLLLGTLSPFAIQLLHLQEGHNAVGKTSGKIFFWSTVGSITGSIGSGFLLIPHFGVKQIILGVAFFLMILGALGTLLTSKKKVRHSLAIILLSIITSLAYAITPDGTPADVIFSKDGTYEQISVIERDYKGRPIHLLLQDLSSNSGTYLDTGEMIFEYPQYYSLYELFVPKMKRFLMIGGGAYNVPKELLAENPQVHIDVAEIEAELFPIAQKYFGLVPNDKLTNYFTDGRRFLHTTKHKYEMIFSDVYYSFAAVPMHCSTLEFFQAANERLHDGGIFMANFVGSLDPAASPMIFATIKTLKQVFPQIYVFAVKEPRTDIPQNFILVGHKSTQRIDLTLPTQAKDPYKVLKNLAQHEMTIDEADLENVPILTDNYAPVEFLLASVLKQYDNFIRTKIPES